MVKFIKRGIYLSKAKLISLYRVNLLYLYLYFEWKLWTSITIEATFIKGATKANTLKNHGVHPVLFGKWAELPVFPYPCPYKCFLHHKYANKGFYKEFALQSSFVVIFEWLKLGVLAKWTLLGICLLFGILYITV